MIILEKESKLDYRCLEVGRKDPIPCRNGECDRPLQQERGGEKVIHGKKIKEHLIQCFLVPFRPAESKRKKTT
jgi:hypothetical protein